jgi:hypothetical protein
VVNDTRISLPSNLAARGKRGKAIYSYEKRDDGLLGEPLDVRSYPFDYKSLQHIKQ